MIVFRPLSRRLMRLLSLRCCVGAGPASVGRAAAMGALLISAAGAGAQEAKPMAVEQILPLVDRYCGACHAVPSPALLPRHSWPIVIDSMVELARTRSGQELIPEEHAQHIKALYYGSSPEALPTLPYMDEPHPSIRFSAHNVGKGSAVPQILNVQTVDLGRGADHSFLVSDGERQQVILLEARRLEDGLSWEQTALANIDIPIMTRVGEYSESGRLDILVADLGEFPPTGKLAGKVYLLRQEASGEFSKHLLLEGLGRVTDIQALDLDGDGDLDLAVSVFGGADVGEVFWLERGDDGDYTKHELLGVSGALNITPADLNGNGRPDLLTLVAQEHETLIAFINQGDSRPAGGLFERMEIASGGHPLFGATSMIVEDLDQDGDPDIVFTNGDAFDTQPDPKPYHGVQWLENKGDLEFVAHDVGRFYGAANVAVGDINGDGSLDIVASSWLNYWEDERRQSLVWFENDGKQQFQPRSISAEHRGLVPVELLDMTGNGRLDIVAGSFRMDILKDFMSRDKGVPALNIEAMKADKREPSPRLMWFENEQLTE